MRLLAPESVLAWIIAGGITGWLAGLLVKGYGSGLIGNIIIGIPGAGIAGAPAHAPGGTRRIGQLRVKLGGNLDVPAESAFPTVTDIVNYGRDLWHVRRGCRDG
jgi:uncharacterized membrane protein YeaQ/YmgE (transglycosylase-associated protein family)